MAKKTTKTETAFTKVAKAGLVVYWDSKHCKASFDVQAYDAGTDLTYGDIRRLLLRALEATLDKRDDERWDATFISAADMIKKLHLREAVAALEKEEQLHRTEEDEQDD